MFILHVKGRVLLVWILYLHSNLSPGDLGKIDNGNIISWLWWADFGQQPGTHPASLSLPLLIRTQGENMIENLTDWNKDKKIIH